MKNKKKAFTLTELLVVVIVIGVLSAAVLPKFSKVIETRKTTEAEELMASIRTEQEKRCALDKQYIMDDISKLNDIVTNPDTKNYQLTLQGTGVIASSKGKYSYTLEMPSYLDGRICCRGNDCEKLNKNYPNCDGGFTYEPSPENCAGTVPPVEPETKNCTGTAVTERACSNGCGTEHRTATCNTATGNWEYGAWDNSCAAKPDPESRECEAGYTGTQTRSAVCKNGVWDWGDWIGECTEVCNNPDGQIRCESVSRTGHVGVWDLTTCSCICPSGTSEDEDGGCSANSCVLELTAAVYEQRVDICKNGSEEHQKNGTAVPGYWDESECRCRCMERYGAQADSNGGCYRDNCSTLPSGSSWKKTAGYCEEPPENFRTLCAGGYYSCWNCGAGCLRFAKGRWDAAKCQCNCPRGSYLDDYSGKLACRVSSSESAEVYEEYWDNESPLDEMPESWHESSTWGEDGSEDIVDWGGW